MKIPADVIIAPEKLRDYLLAPRLWDDKSRFLARAGVSRADPSALERAIRHLARSSDAVEDGTNEYGTFLRLDGDLTGPNNRTLPVTLIWLQRKIDGHIHLVTLKPRQEPRR